MTCKQATDYLLSFPRFSKKTGTQNVQKLLDILGNPQDKLRFIHVAGTNGKGSVCTMLSSILASSGYRTGLFISPYIVDFRERIQINNQLISEQTLVKAVTAVQNALKTCDVDNYCGFQIMTAVAFLCYLWENCDIVVLETGIGGLNDSTNVVQNTLCSVFTTIDLDHTQVLGDTISAIAREKSGIIKPNSNVVTATQHADAMAQLIIASNQNNSKLHNINDITLQNIGQSLDGMSFVYNGTDFECSLIGTFQQENIRVVLKTVEVINSIDCGIKITIPAIKKGLKSVCHYARFEVISKDPPVIIDGAHNLSGLTALKQTINLVLPKGKKVAVIAMMSDKDVSNSLQVLNGVFDTVFVTGLADNSRAMTTDNLYSIAKSNFDNVYPINDVKTALDKATALARDLNCPLVICGSLYLASCIRNMLLK